MSRVLILRPQPGADETARRAREIGLEPVVAPLFTIVPLAWEAPDAGDYDAVMLTSANAARHGGPQLARLAQLPCYAVGEASATAARAAGFGNVIAGDGDADALLARCAADGMTRLLHLSGREHRPAERAGMRIDRCPVYAADPVETLPDEARAALAAGAIALLHSPRAAALFAALAGPRERIAVAAISAAAAEAAGEGWKARVAAAIPTDEALLEVAAKLCKTGREMRFDR